ncbi:MAG: alcohol dehydrogenase catalytic domain-containing protein [bacterium]
MRAAFLTGPRTIECKDIPAPNKGENEVLVRVRAAGVCGSDLHFYSAGRIGEFVLKGPFVMGHEFSGVVEDPGTFADRLPKGTRVAIEPSIVCDSCLFCCQGRPNLCLNLSFVGFPPKGGGFAEYVSIPPQNLYPLPDSIRDEEAPLVETFAIALHTVELMGEVSGKTVAILGAGPVGLLTLLELRRCGASVSFVTEPVSFRRETARSFGAEAVLDPHDSQTLSKCQQDLDGLGPDFVVEAAGEPESFQQALDIVRPGGTVVYCGIYPLGSMPIDFNSARRKELRVLFVRRSVPRNYSEAVRLVAGGEIDLSKLAGGAYPLDRISEAFRDAEARIPGLIKAILLLG